METKSKDQYSRPYRFVLMGASLGTGNMGVSALAASTIGLVHHHRPNAEVRLFIGDRSATPQSIFIRNKRHGIPVINYRWSPRGLFSDHIILLFGLALLWRIVPITLFRNWLISANWRLKALATADLVGEIRGGDSFSDIYGLRRFLMGTFPLCIPLLLKKTIWFLPQTYGPFKSHISKTIAAFFTRKAAGLLSRDKESMPLIKDLSTGKRPKPSIQFCPDVAFTLEINEVQEPEIIPPLELPLHCRLIGFNINGLMYNGGYTRSNMFSLKLDYRSFASLLVDTILTHQHNRILLVPHTFGSPGNVNSDPDACFAVIERLPEELKSRVHMVTQEYDQSALKCIIGKCDFFIGSRMHSCIAALSQGIPTIGVAYSKKFIGVFNAVGAGDWVIDGRTKSATDAVKIISTFIDEIDPSQNNLQNQLTKAKEQIHESFRKLLG